MELIAPVRSHFNSADMSVLESSSPTPESVQRRRFVFPSHSHVLEQSTAMVLYNPFPVHDPELLVWSVRAFYIFAAYAILVLRFIPDLSQRFLDYGARKNGKKTEIKDSTLPRWVRIQFDPVFDWLADITVPHSWFAHFYVCSSICSAYWLYQHRNVLQDPMSATDWEFRALICIFLLQLQSLRRLYECLVIAKASRSRMWVGHYLIGLAFYIVTNVAVWLEPACRHPPAPRPLRTLSINNPFTIAIALRLLGCVYMFCYFSWKQYQVHAYLASLKEYRVPDHPIFIDTNLICPHYSFEVNIYVAFAILTARDTRMFNTTMMAAVAFVVVNLGVTADLTKKWQLHAFPTQRVRIAARTRMLSSIW